MDELNTGSVEAGKPSESVATAPTQAPTEPAASAQINPNVAALQQPMGDINKDSWAASLKNPELKGYAELKNWKDTESVVESYRNLEKLMGADKAERGVVLPAQDDAKGWGEFYDKLGRPASPDDYKLTVPEGFDDTMTKETAKWMHEAGLSKQQAEAIYGKYNEYLNSTMQALEAKQKQDAEREVQDLYKQWGKDSDMNIELSRRGMKAAGIDADTMAQLERSLGPKRTYEIFKNVGANFVEDVLVSNNQMNPMGMSPEAARVRLETLKNDAAWRERYLNGDVAARQEFQSLVKVGRTY
jgi:hypothetical protein